MNILPLAVLLPTLLAEPPAEPVPAGQNAISAENGASAAGALSPEAAKLALAPLNPYVGQWRGVGQVRRGSRQGAWSETGEWIWDFSDPSRPAVRLQVEEGKELSRLLVRPSPKGTGFVATLTQADGATSILTAAELGDSVEFLPVDDGSDRLTLKRLNEKRFTLLIERRSSPTGRFRRVAEVGYTRQGQRLAESSLGGPECVVSGGLGTVEVSHAGKTYYVCCTGCVAAFEADPEGTLADYRARKAEEAAAAKADAAKGETPDEGPERQQE
ncbi:hypothetical protein [Alienimonas chondri]|uniref:YHS domain-containing protein n=1 Tax=Alienimonas chondri TaxID=2681879 RepID=A0ABX1VDB9_9PLAN|nr:hypothetical protein [Alienimonas chondri]NNJ25232.1 hypothetical protein [Alienimonas chondri]